MIKLYKSQTFLCASTHRFSLLTSNKRKTVQQALSHQKNKKLSYEVLKIHFSIVENNVWLCSYGCVFGFVYYGCIIDVSTALVYDLKSMNELHGKNALEWKLSLWQELHSPSNIQPHASLNHPLCLRTNTTLTYAVNDKQGVKTGSTTPITNPKKGNLLCSIILNSYPIYDYPLHINF